MTRTFLPVSRVAHAIVGAAAMLAAVLAPVPSAAQSAAASPPPGAPSPAQVVRALEPAVQLADSAPRRFTLAERMAHYQVPGVSVAVLHGGRIAWARGWGVADRVSGRPVDSTTLFQAASISKPLAALTALSLVQEGRLRLDAPIDDALTSWHVPPDSLGRDSLVTLRRLLEHTAGTTVSGFPGYRSASRTADVTVPSNVDVLNGVGNTPAVRVGRDPDTGFLYSGGGYTIVEQAIEDVTGRAFEDVAAARVLAPAGMTRSTFAQPLPARRWAEAAHAHDARGAPVPGGWHDYPEQAAAGLWTTPTDLLRLGLHLSAVWRGERSDGLVSRALLTDAFAHRGDQPGFDTYGLGFGITGAGDSLSFGHNGGNEGFLSTWIIYPARGEGIAVMTNGARGFDLAQEVVRGVARALGWPAFGARVRATRALGAEALAAYEGRYALPGGGVLTLEAADGALLVRAPNQPPARLLADATATDRFFDPDDGQEIVAERDATGRVTALVAGGRVRIERITPP